MKIRTYEEIVLPTGKPRAREGGGYLQSKPLKPLPESLSLYLGRRHQSIKHMQFERSENIVIRTALWDL